jgi:uncharacterized surface protein with fasciclin (FAS1) repeats
MTTTDLLRNLSLVFTFSALIACGSDGGDSAAPLSEPAGSSPADGPGSILEVAQSAGNFETLLTAVEAAGLESTLADANSEFTVFAPTDEAFEALPDGTLDSLLTDPEQLSNILLYHVIADSAVASDTALSLVGTTQVMASGEKLALTLRGDALYLNESVVIETDIEASNGVIHVIDAVLTPVTIPEPQGSIVDIALSNPELTTLVAALQAADLVDTLADETATFTVFAPTDEAFTALGDDTIATLLSDTESLTDVLLYHIVGGAAADSIDATSRYGDVLTMANEDEVAVDIREGELFVNEARIIIRDIPATNGIIHVIDAVLLPESKAGVAASRTIGDIASADPRLSTLATVLEAAGLVLTLADETATFTVFAPTDAAFAALGENTILELLGDITTLADILAYHVIADQTVDANTAISLNGSDVEMLNGDTVSISVEGDVLYINDSAVIVADISAANGVIHIIDTVLSPPGS